MISKSQAILGSLILLTVLCLLVFYKGQEIYRPVTSVTNYLLTVSITDSAGTMPVIEYYDTPITTCTKQPASRYTELNITEIITPCVKFMDRVRQYNIAIGFIRNRTLSVRNPEEWHGAQGGTTVDVVWGANDDFLQQLGKYPDVQTVSLPWLGTRSNNWSSLTDTSNLLVQKYYEWTASDRLCKWIETPGVIAMKYDVTFNRTCHRSIKISKNPQSIKPVFLHMKPVNPNLYWPNGGEALPAYFHQNTTPYVFYMHIVPDAIVTEVGDVYAPHVKIVPYGCSDDRNPVVPSLAQNQPVYDELFVIAQHWGTAIFHRLGEIVPRLAGWIYFLQKNPQIQIFANEPNGGRLAELLRILDLDPSRLTTQWGRAKVAYVPRASYCGTPSLQESQIVSAIYRRHIVKVLGAIRRNRIILIRRSGGRRLTEQDQIERVLQKLSTEYGLIFEMFIDNPVPSLNDTMRMFHSAVMVVAPHGAGLANLYFSQPGTYVIEGVCNLPHVNFCFQRLAVILGHHWHGIPSRGGCEGVVDVSALKIESRAKAYLQFLKLNN